MLRGLPLPFLPRQVVTQIFSDIVDRGSGGSGRQTILLLAIVESVS